MGLGGVEVVEGGLLLLDGGEGFALAGFVTGGGSGGDFTAVVGAEDGGLEALLSSTR